MNKIQLVFFRRRSIYIERLRKYIQKKKVWNTVYQINTHRVLQIRFLFLVLTDLDWYVWWCLQSRQGSHRAQPDLSSSGVPLLLCCSPVRFVRWILLSCNLFLPSSSHREHCASNTIHTSIFILIQFKESHALPFRTASVVPNQRRGRESCPRRCCPWAMPLIQHIFAKLPLSDSLHPSQT